MKYPFNVDIIVDNECLLCIVVLYSSAYASKKKIEVDKVIELKKLFALKIFLYLNNYKDALFIKKVHVAKYKTLSYTILIFLIIIIF